MSYPHSTFYAKTPEETEVLSKDLASAVAAQSPIEAISGREKPPLVAILFNHSVTMAV